MFGCWFVAARPVFHVGAARLEHAEDVHHTSLLLIVIRCQVYCCSGRGTASCGGRGCRVSGCSSLLRSAAKDHARPHRDVRPAHHKNSTPSFNTENQHITCSLPACSIELAPKCCTSMRCVGHVKKTLIHKRVCKSSTVAHPAQTRWCAAPSGGAGTGPPAAP